MASVREVSSFTEDLLCPICLSFFREPHILECGHSFCAPCLEPSIPKGQNSGLCPECRRPFTLRHMNRALGNLAEKARLLKLDERAQLSGIGGWYFCEEHDEPLKLFCTQDEESVCVICRDLPQHQGHDFLPIKNAVQTYRDQLKASLEPLEEGLRRLKRSQCHQQENIIELKTCSESLSDHVSGEFAEMHQLLNDRELGIKQALENQREKNLAEMKTKLKELDCKMVSHSETVCRIQASLECKDHISFLKEAKELLEMLRKEQGAVDEPELDAELVGEDGQEASSEDVEECENETDEDADEEEVEEVEEEKKEEGEEEERAEEEEEKEETSVEEEEEEEETSDEEEEEEEETAEKEEEEEETSDEEEEEEEETAEKEEEQEEDEDGVVAVDLKLGEFKGPLQFYAWKELLGAVHPVPSRITLDCNSAHPSLVLVEEATGVKFSPGKQSLKQRLERFITTPFVLGREGVTTGRFYWEIQVGDSPNWIVGMAKKSVKHKKWLDFLPMEGVWAIELEAGEYLALSETRTPLSVCGRMEKVGVYLDIEGGQLSFYNRSSMSHLYTFQACFHGAHSKRASMLPLLSTRSSYPLLLLEMWEL